MINLQWATAMLERWGIRRFDILPNEFVAGSPERALGRAVVEDFQGNRFVLEQLASDAFDVKNIIASRIDQLYTTGLTVCPYLKAKDGQWIQHHGGFCGQLAPLMPGVALDRRHYWKDGWRGEAVGHFLADLFMTTRHWAQDGAMFSLPGYIEGLFEQIKRHDPEYLPGIEPIAEFLRQQFYPIAESIPSAFCHGDPHPLNTIWGENRIITVIDWEFCGWKPVLYDTALVLGCVGAEAPEARYSDFTMALLDTLKKRCIYSEEEFALLPIFVLAVRFGWLSEWLRRKDVEMIEFECYYMSLLMSSLNGNP